MAGETTSTPMFTSNQVAGMYGVSAITGAFMAYQSGQMKKLAYEHEAAMAEINAKQIGIDAQFLMADKNTQLANTLAMQNVVAAATGRAGGTVDVLAQSSEAALKKEEKRIRLTGEARSVSAMMDAASSRAAGETAAQYGLLSGVSSLTQGGAQAARYIS